MNLASPRILFNRVIIPGHDVRCSPTAFGRLSIRIIKKIMNKKDELQIDIIKFGIDKLEDGITFNELYAHIKDRGYEVNEYRMKMYFLSSYESLNMKDRGGGIDTITDTKKFALTVESTFRLIEYEEFKNANRNALTATRYATAAIFVSIVTLFISIYYSNKQLSTSTKINDEQLNKVIQLKFDDSNAIKKLEEIIKNQQLQIDDQKEHSKAISRKDATPTQSSTTNTKQ